MLGLLAKAHELRDRLTREGRLREDITFDPESGISPEDQKEILREIDEVAGQSRMKVTPELFAVRAVKKGVLFPIVVNVAAILVLGAGLGGGYVWFQGREQSVRAEKPSTITAEGKLIQQVRKEAEAKLQEKNQEINQIQDRLAQIDKQRQQLQSDMDAKVGQREKELRDAMAAELATERDKLKSQGLTDEAITSRLSDLETQKNADLGRQLDVYKAQAEQERQKSEDNLKALQAEYSANLDKANAERQQVMTDSQSREAALQAQFQQQTTALETAKTQAEQALQSVSAQKAKEDLVVSQLTGLYGIAKTDIAQRDYDKALVSLQAVRDFVNRPDLATVSALTSRRDFDLFVVDSLSSLVQEQIDKSKVDTASLVMAANEISDVRAHVATASSLVSAGKLVEAQKAYEQALQVVPEIAKSFAYVSQADQDAETARQARLRDALSRAEAAFDAGRAADAVAAYRSAFTYLPETSDRLDKTISHIQAAGFALGAEQSRQEQSRAAAALLTQAQAAGKPENALGIYVQILAKYPYAAQVSDAILGIQTTTQSLVDAATRQRSKSDSDLNAQITSLQQTLATRQADFAALQAKYDALSKETVGGQQKMSVDLKAAQDENKKLQGQVDGLQAQLDKAAQQASAQRLSQADARTLKALQDRIAALEKSYKTYASEEDPLLAARGTGALVDTKPYLDSFLGSKAVEETFPGLLARIRRYDQGFQNAGRADALRDVLDIAIAMSRSPSAADRKKLFDGEFASYAQDAEMTSLLQELQGLVK